MIQGLATIMNFAKLHSMWPLVTGITRSQKLEKYIKCRSLLPKTKIKLFFFCVTAVDLSLSINITDQSFSIFKQKWFIKNEYYISI